MLRTRSVPACITGIAALAVTALLIAMNTAGAVPDYRTRTEGVELNRIGIRFLPETGARVRGGHLVSVTGRDLRDLESIITSFPGAMLQRRFPRSEGDLDRDRRLGEEKTRQSVPDLNLFALLTLPPASDDAAGKTRLRDVLGDLNAAPGVAEAWALPKAEVAGFPGPAMRVAIPKDRSDTPDFSPLQGYLYDSPVGVWADSVWGFPGGQGEGVKMIDMEFGWLFTHEDLKAPWYYSGQVAEADHGTAVLGEFGGQHNGFGIQGIAPEMEFGAIYVTDLAAAINEACDVLSPGDLFLIEIQITGPYGWMPMEWEPDVFAAISNATALGIICIEAGANGSVDLDDPYY
jgi:hypothetical protein